MTKKFNPKTYLGKNRIERAVSKNPGISKIWVWNEFTQEYQPPKRGNAFIATRKRVSSLISKEEKASFPTLELARQWRNSVVCSEQLSNTSSQTPLFQDVVSEYRKKRFPQLRPSTCESYEKMLKGYFAPLFKIKMSHITPKVIDEWIEYLKGLQRTSRRSSFEHEFNLFSGIMKFYAEHDDSFISPVKLRHRRDIKVKSYSGVKSKFIPESDFLKFREELLKGKNGELFYTMATVQFYQALRVSEVAALEWSDVSLDTQNPENSVLSVSKSVYFARTKGMAPTVLNSFKNSKVNDGIKVAPIFRESGQALMSYKNSCSTLTGLIFKQDNGNVFTYRQIQHAYDEAFKGAELPYTGTHVMRHGGASNVYNKSNGDLSMVQAITGNRDMKSALIYSHRDPIALKNLALKDWQTE